jgi:cytochrome c heme-lyase
MGKQLRLNGCTAISKRLTFALQPAQGGSTGNDNAAASASSTTWTYPSPQMFYNALSRKGKLGDTSEEDIATVVTLHNHMNEKTWKKVQQWESVLEGTGSDPPKLLRFQGRPTDLSPKAALKHYLLGHPLPYDRHDWTIVHERDGSVRRYVIDYYHDETRSEAIESEINDKNAKATPSLLVDVRPAADDFQAIWSRLITMPYARRVAKSTTFEPLPMVPTSNMKSQVQESVQVWQSIQQSASDKASAEKVGNDVSPSLSEEQARTLAREFAQVMSDCRAAQRRVSECNDEMECARASMDLTVCMGKIVCPLQHTALTKALASSYDGDAKIEAALGVLNDCVRLKTIDHKTAKETYPTLFTKS